MKVLLLRNNERRRDIYKPSKRSTPCGYGDLCFLFDDNPKTSYARGLEDLDIKTLNSFDLIIVENTFYNTWQKPFLRVHKKLTHPKILVWCGAIDRFNRFVKPTHIGTIAEALSKVDYICTLNSEDVSYFYAWAPQAKIFHLPIYVNIDRERSIRPNVKVDDNLVLLSVHSSITLSEHARRGDILNFMVFKRLSEIFPDLKGMTFLQTKHKDSHSTLFEIISKLGLSDKVDIIFHTSKWREYVARSFCSIDLSNTKVQGRWNIHHALLGTPIISTDEIESQRILFPDLTVKWWDSKDAIRKFCRLKSGPLNRDSIVEYAYRKLGHYSASANRRRISNNIALV